jgi:hypothetical protein
VQVHRPGSHICGPQGFFGDLLGRNGQILALGRDMDGAGDSAVDNGPFLLHRHVSLPPLKLISLTAWAESSMLLFESSLKEILRKTIQRLLTAFAFST